MTIASLHKMLRHLALGSLLPLIAPDMLFAEDVSVPDVVVSASRVEEKSFDSAASISSLSGVDLRNTQWQVNSSEAFPQVPGVNVQNRQSYSQDQQISIRGYGARSGFGVRGIRIVVDDIPASMPDGQGQTGTMDFSTAQRVEVLRGPLANLYGNHGGGVIQLFTEDGPPQPTAEGGFTFGSYGTWRAGIKFAGQEKNSNINYVMSYSRFMADGYRDHSSASRNLGNLKLSWGSEQDRLSLIVNDLDQPGSQDPLGLTNEQWRSNPRQAIALATQFDTHRDLANRQGGIAWRHQFDNENRLKVTTYYGTRTNSQYLAIPLAAQNIATASGGLSRIDRSYWGLGAEWSHQTAAWSLVSGLNYETLSDARTGYINNNGQQGALKRDEDNLVDSISGFVQGELPLNPQWSLVGGLRYSQVRFQVKDHYIVAGNGDDSGKINYNSLIPAAGVVWHAKPFLNFYANAGRGFETPTTAELAYRLNGSGPNLDLKPANSTSGEAGLKVILPADTRIDFALFTIRTNNDLVVVQNSGGRTVYGNSKTRRSGAELSVTSRPIPSVKLLATTTWLRGTFADTDRTLPGTPDYAIYAQASWEYPAWGFMAAANWQASGKIRVDDGNNAAPAPSYNLLGLALSFTQQYRGWVAREFLRADNLADENYVSGVVLNDANGRYYYPGNGRSWLAGLTLSHAF